MTDMIPFSAGVPAHIREAGQSELTKGLMQSVRSGRRISIRGKMFRLVVSGEEIAKRPDSIDVVIVNVAKDISRVYYAGSYDPKAEASAPTCWSTDSKVPHPSVENPQSRNCNDCPMNVKGSGQGQSRACRFKRRIAVVLADSIDSGVHMLELPATSLFGTGDLTHMPYEQYFKYVSGLNHSIDRVVTRISFDEDSDAPKMFFAPIGFPSAEMMPKLAEYGASLEAKSAVTMTVYQADRPRLGAPAEAVESAPVVKPSRKEATAAPVKKDLNSVLSKFAGTSKSADTDDE
jgi:hypothetical protein